MSPIINVEKIGKTFGRYSILEDLSLQIDPGTVYGLVGLNGAGKTTFLRLLLGILKPDSGQITILGIDPWSHSKDFYRKTGVVLDNDGFWGNLTIRENISIYADAKGLNKQTVKEYLDEFWQNTALYDNTKKVKHLSRGQKMQCALCRAFLGWPSVFFLDEPALALDMTAYEHLCIMVKAAEKKGAVVIISSHQLDTIDMLCNRVGILRDKNLSELQRLKNDTNRWIVVTDNSNNWRSVIELCGGKSITYDNGWQFDSDDRETMIPDLIRKLVEAGCMIREVKRLSDNNNFGTAIRNIYSNFEK
jgi:ABC-2 type transport system ATP-binding protein